MPCGKCGGCDYRVSCGGCRARALATTGDLMAEDGKCNYCPPSSSAPESVPQQRTATISWTPEAQAMLDRIPGFVRDRIRNSLEQKAQAAGAASISAEFMQVHRPASLPFARPAART
jgi:hypothetical protein